MLSLLVVSLLAAPPLAPTTPTDAPVAARNERLQLATPEGTWPERAAYVVAQRLPGLHLGEAKVSQSHRRVAVSFELLGPDDAPVFERRVAVVLLGEEGPPGSSSTGTDPGTAMRLHFDGLPAVGAAPGPLPASVATTVAERLGGQAGPGVAGWLALPYGPLEPVWRVPLVVVPFLDHRWVYVSRATGELVRWTPSAKDGAVTQ